MNHQAMKDLLRGLIAHSETGVQTRLALALGVRVQTVNKWAKGHTAPDMARWGQIEEFFGLEPGAFAAAAGVQPNELREADNLRARVTQLEAQVRAMAVQVERLGFELDADDGLPGDATGDDQATTGGHR